jgi:hypothetical protein
MNRSNIDDTHSSNNDQAEAAGARNENARPWSRGKRGDGSSQSTERKGPRVDMAQLREVGRNLGTQLEQQAVRRPYVVVGASLGVGFVAGSLFGSRIGQMVLAVGLGYAAKNVFGGGEGMERIRGGIDKLAETLDAD